MKKPLSRVTPDLVFIVLVSTLISALIPFPAFAAPPLQGEDPKTKADALYQEGVNLSSQGDYQGALDRYQKALTIYEEINDQVGEGETLNDMGLVYRNLGEYPQALKYYEQALTIRRQIGPKVGEGVTLFNIAVVYRIEKQSTQALNYYGQALAIFQQIDDQDREGATLNNIGSMYLELDQYKDALETFEKGLAIYRKKGSQKDEGYILYGIGVAYRNLEQYQQALDSYVQALAIYQEIGPRSMEAKVLDEIGVSSFWIGKFDQALESYQEALVICREISDRTEESTILTNMGGVYVSRGQYNQALDYFQNSLAVARETKQGTDDGTVLNNIGVVHRYLGQYPQALDYYRQALLIAQQLNDQHGQQVALSNIGLVYLDLSQYRQALTYFQESLALTDATRYQLGKQTVLNNIAGVYGYFGQFDKSLDYYLQALEISQKIGDRVREKEILGNIGETHLSLNQGEKAVDYLKQALSIHRETGNRREEGVTLNNIGAIYRNLKQYDLALDYFHQALLIHQEIGNREEEQVTLSNIGYVYEQEGNNVDAITQYEKAVQIIESIQSDLKVEELKASFLAQQSSPYRSLIELLWETGHFQEAFNYAERARARAFLDQLAAGHVDFRAGSDTGLLAQEQSLRNEIMALNAQLITLRSRPQSEWDTDGITSAEADLDNHETDYAQLLAKIKLQSPEVAGLVSVDVASLADVQSLIDNNTTLIEYYSTDNRIIAFVITHNTFETTAVDVHQDELIKTIVSFRDFANLQNAYPASLQQLYTWLIAPLRDKLKTPVLGIIPYGMLHYLPFAALIDGKQYLGDEYSLFTLPSASTLRFIQAKRKPATNTILALGNPTTTEPGLAPLQFAQDEVAAIAKLYGTQPLIGNVATESALRSKAGKASIVHLAAHGKFNSDNPLFSTIYLAPDQQEDGRLEVNEIYSLDLTKATDLVVLSACETQVGNVSAGDEVVGMTRAFLYAGTPTVIASLWDVDDKATTLLMEHFYSRLREGMGKAQALQQAQSDVRTQYPNPYYWAAFVLTGDPGKAGEVNTVHVPEKNKSALWIAGLVGIFFLLIGGAAVLRKRIRRTKP